MHVELNKLIQVLSGRTSDTLVTWAQSLSNDSQAILRSEIASLKREADMGSRLRFPDTSGQ